MRKRFVLAAVAAVAAIAVVWSVTTLAKPKGAALEASAPGLAARHHGHAGQQSAGRILVASVLIRPGAPPPEIDGSLALKAGRSPVPRRRSAGGARSCLPISRRRVAQPVGVP